MCFCLKIALKLRINDHIKATKKASRIVIKSTLLPPLRNSYSRDQKDELVSRLISDVNASKLLKSENYMVGLQQTIKSINSKKAEIVLIGKDLDFFCLQRQIWDFLQHQYDLSIFSYSKVEPENSCAFFLKWNVKNLLRFHSTKSNSRCYFRLSTCDDHWWFRK